MVVQRFGPDIAGGAEQLVRETSERLATRGHDVEVLTSCAESSVDWANCYPPGERVLNGVLVHRLEVQGLRPNRLFGPLTERVRHYPDHAAVPTILSDEWTKMIGPDLPELLPWLAESAHRFDVIVFSGYMFPTSTVGLPFAAALRPTVIQAVAHDEPFLRLPAIRPIFEHAAGICALTVEEGELIRRRFRPQGVMSVVGAGVEAPPALEPADVAAATDAVGLTGRRYLISVGRIEDGKGTPELVDYFGEYLERHDPDLHLLLVGRNVSNLRRKRNVVMTDFVSEDTKWRLLAGAEALVQPSYFESFSLSLVEGWLQGLPALVQGRCDVLAGQVRRSGGGLSYTSFSEFDAALTVLTESAALRQDLAESGRRYSGRYEWDVVLDAFEDLAARSIERWHETERSRC